MRRETDAHAVKLRSLFYFIFVLSGDIGRGRYFLLPLLLVTSRRWDGWAWLAWGWASDPLPSLPPPARARHTHETIPLSLARSLVKSLGCNDANRME